MKYVVGNWKMFQRLEDIKKFFIELNSFKQPLTCEAWIAPQFIHIPLVKDLAFTLGKISVGAQNCATTKEGALTGEVSAQALADTGCSFVIIGHSERRKFFAEDNHILQEKLTVALAHGLKVIFCVGETGEEREQNKTFEVLSSQLSILKNTADLSSVIVAYEPVWAIGTGKNATPEQAQEVHSFIRKSFSVPLLYGGSVNPSNIGDLLVQKDIDGVLVGGASLKGKSFAELCLIASQFQGDLL